MVFFLPARSDEGMHMPMSGSCLVDDLESGALETCRHIYSDWRKGQEVIGKWKCHMKDEFSWLGSHLFGIACT